jgi:hypothetical protein
MANVVAIQVTEDGPRNSCFKVDISLDTSNLSATTIWDPAAQYIDPLAVTNSCAIDEIQYAVQDGLSVDLLWDATTPKSIVHLEGRGKFPMDWAGGIPNNAGAGRTGKIVITTAGWASGVLAAALFIQVHKTAL